MWSKNKINSVLAIMVATASTEHSYWLTLSFVKRKRQPIGMIGRTSGNHNWLLANGPNASACVSCGFRLRNARNARDCV